MSNMTDRERAMLEALTKAVADIASALILAKRGDKITEWVAPYVAIINEHDALATGDKP